MSQHIFICAETITPPPKKKNMGSMSNRDIKMQMKQCRKVPKLNF